MQRRKTREEDNLFTEEHDLKEANYGSLKKNPESKIKEYIYETMAFGPEKVVKMSTYESFGGNSEHISKDANQSKQKKVEGDRYRRLSTRPTTLKVPQWNKGCLVNSTTNFFSDEKTRIDFILVWESNGQNSEGQKEENPKSKQKSSIEIHKEWREKFLHKLQMKGIRIEKHSTQHTKKVVHFILLNAPWSVLCYYAEDLRLRVPLQAMPTEPEINWSHKILMKLGIPNLLYDEVPDIPLDNYTCLFKANKLPWFSGSDNHETFFSTTQRHRILYEILSTTSYGKPKAGQVGIERLMNEEVFTAAFPLHDGPYKMSSEEEATNLLNQRQILFHYWARWSKWKKYQPLNHIRRYFGEKIALYFAWLGFYTAWLLPAAIVGTLVFVIGIFMMFHDIPTQEICSSGDKYKMCPICKVCPYWNLSTVCPMFQAGRLFDHGGTVFFSIFMSLWAVTFLEYWKRMNATLIYSWDCSDFEDIEERPRPQFAALAPMTTINPITGEEEPYFPKRTRFNRIMTGSMVIIIMIAVVIIFLISVILYRAIIAVFVSRSGNFLLVSSASRIASLTGSVVNLLFILLLSKIYIALALFLTKWEMHRTQTAFEDAFTFKVFIFEFINFYSSPIYIAFFKGRFVGYPGHYDKLLGIRNEDCAPGGCLIELAQELLVIMVGKQVINNIQEVLIPITSFSIAVLTCMTPPLPHHHHHHHHQHHHLCHNYHLPVVKNWWDHKPEKVVENKHAKILWDFRIQTDKVLEHNTLDLTIVEKKKVWIIDVAIPGDSRIEEKQQEKLSRYQDLKIELQRLWHKPVQVVPVVIGTLGAVPKDLSRHLKTINIDKITICQLQKATVLGSAHIIRKYIT